MSRPTRAQANLPQVNLERWRPHVLAALRSGQSVVAYARDHQLSRHTLYMARMNMRRNGELQVPAAGARRKTVQNPRQRAGKAAAPAFVPVTLTTPAITPPTLIAMLPNGVRLHVDMRDEAALQALLQHLVRLPCSV